MANGNVQPIIIKKVKKGGHGHHGGAWKIAYADFVTAMMAFFLLLWLISMTTPEQKKGLADYFAPPNVSESPSGAGGVMGGLCLIGLLILIHRRMSDSRIRAATRPGDKLLLAWILATLLLGLSTIALSAGHMDGEMMVRLMTWAQHIVTFQGDAASHIAGVPFLFKAHLFMGLTLFVIFPFTRLVHVWSGFASLGYLGRAWQLVRPR